MTPQTIWIGFDPRPSEAVGFAVARYSVRRHLTQSIPIHGLILDELRSKRLYTRPTFTRDGQLFDVLSNHTMATEFAISRFLVPKVSVRGWALFMDADMLVRGNLVRLFEDASPHYAVMCVKHNHVPDNAVKMDNQQQSIYARKNWSSFMLFNCDHPSNQKLTLEMINTRPGRDLHRFCWLEDHEIGELHVKYNWLVGHSDQSVDPVVVHFTDGGPWLEKYRDVRFSEEWRNYYKQWAY